ncbi:16126_t:CDS:2, partial [Racocetra persica]
GERLDQPNFKLDRIYDYVQLGGNAWDITVAESEVIEIVENHEGQENTGGDTVRPASTSVYIEKISRVENEETEEKDFLEQAINALPSDALKKSSNYTATIDIPMGSYTQQIIGFNSS